MRQHERQTLHTPERCRIRFVPLLAAAILLAGCDGATDPGVATYLTAVSPLRVTATVASEVTPAPAVRVADQHRNPMQGMEVVFWITGENGVPASTSALTDASGTATVASWRLATRAGRQTLRAVMAQAPAGEGREVLFVATANPAEPARVVALEAAHAAPAGGNVWLRARVVDAYDNPVAAARVDFGIESGGGSLEVSSAVTDLDGVAGVQWKIGSGENFATASVPGLESARFSATVLQPPFYYDLQPSAQWILPAPSWIRLEEDSRFTASTGGVVGSGRYAISGSSILFTYSDNFLERVGAAFNWWANGTQHLLQEGASFAPDLILIRRCWLEDCYEADWTYRRRGAP